MGSSSLVFCYCGGVSFFFLSNILPKKPYKAISWGNSFFESQEGWEAEVETTLQ